MQNKEYNKKIHLLKKQVLEDIRQAVSSQGTIILIVDDDNTKMNTIVRFYDGNKYPKKVTVTSIQLNDNGTLEAFATDGNRYPIERMHSADLTRLNAGVEKVLGCKTPKQFAALLNKCESFPLALRIIIDANGWYDLTEEDGTGNVAWCPREKKLILFEYGKAIVRDTEDYHSTETDWHDAEIWFRQSDFKTMERISGLRQDDYRPDDGYQDFVNAVERWWASLGNNFPNNGKEEKIRIWKENR